MSDQMIFKRYEIKYMLTQEQKQKVLKAQKLRCCHHRK